MLSDDLGIQADLSQILDPQKEFPNTQTQDNQIKPNHLTTKKAQGL